MRIQKFLMIAKVSLLLTTSSFASVVQPGTRVSEDAPSRISAGIFGNIYSGDKVGLDVLGVGLGLAQNIGNDFTFGLAVSGSWAATGKTLFSDAAKDVTGVRIDAEIMTSFMPELAEDFFFGGVVAVGYNHQFGKGNIEVYDKIKFGDLLVKVGLSTTFSFSNFVSAYITGLGVLNNLRFGLADNAPDSVKNTTNTWGLEIPVGISFALDDYSGFFVQANTRFTNFKDFKNSFNETITAGFTLAI